MKNFAQQLKTSSFFKNLALSVCFIIMCFLFVVIFQQSQSIKDLTTEKDQLKNDLADKSIALALYDEKFDDYKRDLMATFEENAENTDNTVITAELFQPLESFFAEIDFSDGLDLTELYWYDKDKHTADNMNMSKMFTEQLALDNSLLELLEHACSLAAEDSTEFTVIQNYKEELCQEIEYLNDCLAQSQKNLSELADYEKVCPMP